jgi:hypothetical protein
MIYYLFPKTSINISNTCCTFGRNHIPSKKSYSLNHYLKQIENHTRKIIDWEKVCYTSNPYRLLVGGNDDKSVLNMYEILELYNLMKFSWEGANTLNTLHANKYTLSAMEYIRKKNKNDTYFFTDELSFAAAANISIDIAFCEAASSDEYANNLVLIRQLCHVFCVLKKNGTLIVKYGDSFSCLSLDIVTILSHLFEKTFFIKPSICNVTSCEKFIVCKGFLFDSNDTTLSDVFSKLYSSVINCPHEHIIQRILQIDIPLFVCGKLEEVNSIMGQPRLEKIQSILTNIEHCNVTLSSVNNTDADSQKCKDWCDKHKKAGYYHHHAR